MCLRTSSSVSPGITRMSMSRSTTSGITFVFTPPWATFGENVVCVHAWASFATPWSAARSRQAVDHASGRARCLAFGIGRGRAHRRSSRQSVDGTAAAGRYAASRRTTSAAFTSALSAPNGTDPWPGVPRTRRRRHATPFSRDGHVDARTPLGCPSVQAARLGQHVVGRDRVALVIGASTPRPVRRPPPRRRRRSRSASPFGPEPAAGEMLGRPPPSTP